MVEGDQEEGRAPADEALDEDGHGHREDGEADRQLDKNRFVQKLHKSSQRRGTCHNCDGGEYNLQLLH